MGRPAERALILVVEDDEANLLLTRTVLEEDGHQVLAAETLGAARELLSLERPNLVLTDIELHGESGLELAREIVDDPRTAAIPVVCLTAHAMPGTELEVFDAGCADYLTKPIDIAELVRRVRDHLQVARGAQDPGAA